MSPWDQVKDWGWMLEAKGVNGRVTFDGAWITINRKGFLGRATVGKGEKRIPVSAVTAVQWKPPGAMVNGFIQFTVPGGNESRSRLGRQTVDAAKDENSVVVSKSHKAEFEALRAAVELAITGVGNPALATSPTSVADELAKLARLRDQGVLSAEEFDEQKARLLA